MISYNLRSKACKKTKKEMILLHALANRLKKVSSKQSGFTLVELLVVIAIIMILSAFLVPKYLQYTQNARVSQTMGSLASMKSIIEAYAANEGNGNYPTAGSPAAPPANGILSPGADISTVLQTKGVNWTGSNGGVTDAWGDPYQYIACMDNNGNVWGYILESRGPDRKGNTADDIYVTSQNDATQGTPPTSIGGYTSTKTETSNGSSY